MATSGGYGVNRNGGGMSAYGRGDEGPPLGSGRRFEWEADAARRKAAGTDIRLGDRVSHRRYGVGVVRDHCGSEECRVSFPEGQIARRVRKSDLRIEASA